MEPSLYDLCPRELHGDHLPSSPVGDGSKVADVAVHDAKILLTAHRVRSPSAAAALIWRRRMANRAGRAGGAAVTGVHAVEGLIGMVLAHPAGVFAEQARFSFDGLIGLVRKR